MSLYQQPSVNLFLYNNYFTAQIDCAVVCPCEEAEPEAEPKTFPNSISTKETSTDNNQVACNSTLDNEPMNNANLPKALYGFNEYWHIVVMACLVVCIICSPIALVCGSKYPEKVRWLVGLIGLQECIYGNREGGEYNIMKPI